MTETDTQYEESIYIVAYDIKRTKRWLKRNKMTHTITIEGGDFPDEEIEFSLKPKLYTLFALTNIPHRIENYEEERIVEYDEDGNILGIFKPGGGSIWSDL